MNEVIGATVDGLLTVLAWPNILYPVAGTLLSMVVSVIPGIGGVALMAVMLPLTLFWDPLPVVLLFGALLGGATFMGSVTAILINVPGRNSNAATTLDGYPMAQRGEARTAIGCAASASALGSTFGIVVLVLIIPFVREWLLLFGPAELLIVSLWGLLLIASLTRGSPWKGLSMAGLGCLFGLVGTDPITTQPRFTLGLVQLEDGLSLSAVFLGMFALAEAISMLASRRETVSGAGIRDRLGGDTWYGVLSVFRHFGTFLRSSAIGTFVGMLPGVGATVASFLAYGQAARDRSGSFGRGDIRGVIAPEAANDAKDGGALLPTLAFGIPGGTGTAMLLAVFTAHGLTPGRELLGEQLSLTFVLIWSLFLSNWLTSILGIWMAPAFSRLTVVPVRYLAPGIVVVCLFAAHLAGGGMGDVFVAFAFGWFGYQARRFGWSPVPFVVAFVLTPLIETNFLLTRQLHALDRLDFWSRPLTLLFAAMVVISLVTWRLRRIRVLDRRS